MALPIEPTDLDMIRRWPPEALEEKVQLFLTQGMKKDERLMYVFRSLIPEMTLGRLHPNDVMPYNPHFIMVTNTKTGKTRTAELVSRRYDRGKVSRLLGFSTAQDVARKARFRGNRLFVPTPELGSLRQDLGYEEASALERLLIDQVVLCWLRMSHVELHHTAMSNRDTPLSLRECWERRLSATQRRYLRACETLARVRRLRLPSLQINVGDSQVNVAGRL